MSKDKWLSIQQPEPKPELEPIKENKTIKD